MTVTGGANYESYQKSPKERYLEQDNVLDITKEELQKIKSSIDLTKETDFDDQLKKFNELVDQDFDGWMLQEHNRTRSVTLDIDGKPFTGIVRDIIAGKDSKKLNALANWVLQERGFADAIDKIKNAEIKETLRGRRYQLNALDLNVQSEVDPNLSVPTQTTETRDKENTYKYVPENFSLTEGGEANRIERDYRDIAIEQDNTGLVNIFKRGKLWKYMSEILGQGEVEDKIYKINLGAQNGLASLILTANVQPGLREKIQNFGGKPNTFFEDIGLEYQRQGGRDNEEKKVMEIMQKAASDFDVTTNTVAPDSFLAALLDFATEAKGYGFDFEKRVQQGLNFKKVVATATDRNILQVLCDFNGDGQLSIKYFDYQKRKEHQRQWKADYQKTTGALPANWKGLREQDRAAHVAQAKEQKEKGKTIENQGDVGTIFGPQLYDAIETASDVLDVRIKYKDKNIAERYPHPNTTGENIVVYNILQQIRTFNADSKIEDALKVLSPEECTSATLLHLCQTYEEFQGLFAKAMETINGSSSDLAPDLVDSLVGIVDREKFTDIEIPQYSTFKDKIDKIASDPYCAVWQNSAAGQKFLKETKNNDGFVQMQKGVMTLFDNVDVNATLNDSGKLSALGINKARDVNKQKHEMENSFLKNLFGALSAVTFDPVTMSLGLSFGQNGATENLKNLRAWNAGVSTALGTAIIKINVGGEYARQFNYANIVTANLADLGSARYGGVDAGASEIFLGTVPAVTIIEGGIAYKNDPKAAIEQMYKQYNDVSKELFTIENINFAEMDTADKLEQTLLARYTTMRQTFAKTKGRKRELMGQFLDNNKEFITTNIKQIANYFANVGILEAVKASPTPAKALDDILNIFQDGLTNTWRETMYENLAGKISVSKIGLGVGVAFIANTIPLIYPKISLRIKHWRNNYIPVEAQKKIDASLIYSGGIAPGIDHFLPNPPSVEAYGEYIDAIWNIKAYDENTKSYVSQIKTEKTAEGNLRISYLGSADKRITDIIDVRVKVKQDVLDNVKVSADGRSLIIGNVGGITAYTQSDGLGKRCFLILGGSSMENTCRLDQQDILNHQSGIPKQAISFLPAGYQYFSWSRLEYHLIEPIKGRPKEKIEPVKAELKAFFDQDGKLVTPTGKTVQWEGCNVGDQISTGTLTVLYKTDGTYLVRLDNYPTDKVVLRYIHQEIYQNYLNRPGSRGDRTTLTSTDKLLEYSSTTDIGKAETEITTLYDKLMELEDSNPAIYAQFLGEATHATDGEIDENELTGAIIHLEELLGGKVEFTILKTLLGSQTDLITRSYIVDRCKQVLAKEPKYEGQKISTILGWHGETGLNMTGPAETKISDGLKKALTTIRNQWKTDPDTYNNSPKVDKSLIGYTSFYRNIAGNKYESKKFSLTGLGSTSYQKIADIPANVEGDAKMWFMENFKMQGPEMELLAAQLTKQFSDKGISIDMFQQGKAMNDPSNNLRKLLNGEEILVDNGMKKVKLDLAWKFYLLGDCCNESIGLSLLGIKIKTPKESIDENPQTQTDIYEETHTNTRENTIEGYRSSESGSEIKYVSPSFVAGRNLSSSMRVGSYGEEVGLNLSFVPTEKKGTDHTKPEKQDSDVTTPEVGDVGSGDQTGTGIDVGP